MWIFMWKGRAETQLETGFTRSLVEILKEMELFIEYSGRNSAIQDLDIFPANMSVKFEILRGIANL